MCECVRKRERGWDRVWLWVSEPMCVTERQCVCECVWVRTHVHTQERETEVRWGEVADVALIPSLTPAHQSGAALNNTMCNGEKVADLSTDAGRVLSLQSQQCHPRLLPQGQPGQISASLLFSPGDMIRAPLHYHFTRRVLTGTHPGLF